MNRRKNRILTTALGYIEETVHPRETLEIFRAQTDKIDRQVFAPVFLDVTNELLGDVNFP